MKIRNQAKRQRSGEPRGRQPSSGSHTLHSSSLAWPSGHTPDLHGLTAPGFANCATDSQLSCWCQHDTVWNYRSCEAVLDHCGVSKPHEGECHKLRKHILPFLGVLVSHRALTLTLAMWFVSTTGKTVGNTLTRATTWLYQNISLALWPLYHSQLLGPRKRDLSHCQRP